MECFLRDADTQQHKERVICKWVSQVRDLAYDAEDLIQRYLHQVTHHRQDGFKNTLKWFSRIVYTCDAWTHHNLGSDIEDMTIQISDLTSRLQRYGIQIIKPSASLEYSPMSREARMTYSHIEEDVVGFDKDINEVVEQVMRADVKVVSISGTGGLGKTTLARKVFKSIQMQGYYTCAWVCISQEFDTTHIFKEILRGLGEKESVGAAEEIDNILREKKCFVVLDDIWKVDAWNRLKPAFDSMLKKEVTYASKILITTRKQDLLQPVSSVYLHRLKPLSPEYSWELLRSKAFLREGSTDDQLNAASSSTKKEKEKDDDEVTREKLGTGMLKYCGGLPLAIVALGGILSTRKTISQWKDVQENISSYLMSGEGGHENDRISQVSELSYYDLPFYLKPCFLYMCSFPEDYKISAQRLYQLWQAEGLLTVEGEVAKISSYHVGERYLNELVQRSMVQVENYWEDNGRIETCKLHDIMRDLCLKKGEEINFLNTVVGNDLRLENVLVDNYIENRKLRRLSVYWIADFTTDETSCNPAEKKATCVRSLLVFPTIDGDSYNKEYVLLRRVWKPFPLLRVLDLEGAPIKGVLEGVENLIHLRFLSLRDTCNTELPPRFWDLKCVETLDLRCKYDYPSTMRLPSKQLEKLERLKHLYLPCDFEVMEDAATAGKKLSLPASYRMETLVNFDLESCEIKDLLKMTNLRFFVLNPNHRFKDEDELKGVLEAPVMKNSGQLLNTPYLHVNAYTIVKEPTILSSLAAPPSSFSLMIYSYGQDLPSGTVFADSLTKVNMWNFKQIEDATISTLGKLPYLKHLTLYECILGGNKMTFRAGGFPQLTHLHLRFMTELEEWEVEDGALPKFQYLELNRCEKLKKIPQGLPHSLHIQCFGSGTIMGIENYNTRPLL